MELRIDINNCRKQFAGISRDDLSDFQYGVKYQFPYPVRYRQLESTCSGFAEKLPDGLVCLKPFYRAKYIVLHHRQRKAGNLSREVYALALSKIQQYLHVAICHLSRPTSSVRPVCLEEAEREVCGEQSVPLPLPATLREKETHGGTCKLDIDGTVAALQRCVVLDESFLLQALDDLAGIQVAPFGMVLGLAKLNHAQQVALDMTACNESDEVRIGKPAVNEQIVEADTASDGILHHLDGLVGLLHRVLPDALLDSLSTMVLSETSLPLLVRQSLFPAWFPSFLAMKGEVEHQLAQTIGIKQSQTLVAKDSLMLNMGEHLADELTLASALGSIRVIDNQTDSPVILSLAATADLPQQLEVHHIEQLAPLNVTIIHKTIEHVLLTTEQAA